MLHSSSFVGMKETMLGLIHYYKLLIKGFCNFAQLLIQDEANAKLID